MLLIFLAVFPKGTYELSQSVHWEKENDEIFEDYWTPVIIDTDSKGPKSSLLSISYSKVLWRSGGL